MPRLINQRARPRIFHNRSNLNASSNFPDDRSRTKHNMPGLVRLTIRA
jgi:hypothetical protein